MKTRTLIVGIFGVALLALAQGSWAEPKTSKVLTFEEWRKQRVLDAGNQVVRISNRLHIQNSGVFQLGPRGSIQRPEDKQVSEEDLEHALKNLRFARELNMDQYISVYVSQLMTRPEALERLSDKLSQQEVQQLLQHAVKRNAQEPESSEWAVKAFERVSGSPISASQEGSN